MATHVPRGLRIVVVGAIVIASVAWLARPAAGQGPSPIATVLDYVTRILNEVNSPAHGLAEIKREIRAIENAVVPPPGPFLRSSGLFGLPSNAQSVDWMVVNNSTVPQTFTMTVYQAGVGPKTVVAPGPLTLTLAPGEVTHNANSVGTVFHIGLYYEMVIESLSANVLPSVHVWPSHFNEIIPGTLIPAGSWVRLR